MACLSLPRPLHGTTRYKTPVRRIWIVIGASLTWLSFTPVSFAAGVLPQGGRYVGGQGSIAGSGSGLVITQPGSTRGVIDWNSFSIGKNNSVTFDNGAGATLNRVTGGTPSAILGRLSATGSLYVINPQGILVGPSGVVSTGGRFVASTLDVCNCAFVKGGDLTLAGDSNASVVNLGKISSSGGDVFLIARQAVVNAGSVNAPNGTAEFAVGKKVLLQDSASSRQVFVQTGSEGTITDAGATRAAQISLQAADGNIYALAGGGSRIRATGTATRDGHVWLVADDGRVSQRGTITATNADGSGGTVDTQAAQLSFGHDAAVHAGQWNVSTPALTIDTAAARAFRRSLNAGTSVGMTTTGAGGASGDLGVASNLNWHGPAALTLAAYHSVSVAPGTTISNQGAGNLTLRADASGIDNGGSVTNGGVVDWSKSTGIVSVLHDMNGSYTPGTIRANSAWTSPAESGLVTQVTSYKLVNSATDLESVSLDLAGNYALGKDIDIGKPPGVSNTPIGSVANPFSGQFDGMGHAVSQLGISFSYSFPAPDIIGMGLFGVIGSAGVVRNVSVQGGVGGAGTYGGFGLLAGINYGTIAGAHASGGVGVVDGASYLAAAGGLAGMNHGTITRSSSSAAVGSEGDPGGLVGINYETGVIRQSYASGDVAAVVHTGGGGGLVSSNAGHITQSYATGSVTFSPNYCGFSETACTSGGGALVRSNTGTIDQSFGTGQVIQMFGPAGGPPPAGIANDNGGTVANDVFWNTQTTGATAGVITGTPVPLTQGLTTAQMSLTSSFGPTYDFGPNGVWAMPSGATHPVLRWQLAH
ncbi:MAG TPA: filamentous hemagglutinin N-terminal domain-containing protein [Paraburkholderia sp.]|nr:filamentous hemagglutinin N-terminal domain-containing protein [Paraburkholderia sp.]